MLLHHICNVSPFLSFFSFFLSFFFVTQTMKQCMDPRGKGGAEANQGPLLIFALIFGVFSFLLIFLVFILFQ